MVQFIIIIVNGSKRMNGSSGKHHNIHDFENVIKSMLDDLGKSNIRVDGLFQLPHLIKQSKPHTTTNTSMIRIRTIIVIEFLYMIENMTILIS